MSVTLILLPPLLSYCRSVATLLVQQGTVRKGQILVAGQTSARLRSIQNEQGNALDEAPPSTPILTTGWKELPEAGQLCQQVKSEREMQDLVGYYSYLNQLKQQLAALKAASSLNPPEKKCVPLVVKGDVAGSVEALQAILSSCSPKQLTLSLVRSGVGPVSENDVEMAADGKQNIDSVVFFLSKCNWILLLCRGCGWI